MSLFHFRQVFPYRRFARISLKRTMSSPREQTVVAVSEPRVLVPVATGSEDIETVTIVDILNRAGADVTVASVESFEEVVLAQSVKIVADRSIADIANDKFDMIVLPGGNKGAEALRDSEELLHMLTIQNKEKRFIAAICAAPAQVLAHHKFLENKNATCYPAFKKQIPKFEDQIVVVDGHIITSQGPATVMQFALTLVNELMGVEVAKKVANGLLFTAPNID